MENYVPKGYTFPDQDWWEEKKTDVSFLYVDEDDTLSGVPPECIEESEDTWDGSEVVSSEERQGLTLKQNRSRDGVTKCSRNQSLGSKMQLDSWIEESRQEMKVHSRPTGIKTLAGYVNIAYPIMTSLNKRKTKGSRAKNETKTKELQKQIQQVSTNLQHVSSTLTKIQATLDRSYVQQSGKRFEALKTAFHSKSTRMVESCELINVLMNMVKNAAHIPTAQKEASEISRTYGSSVDLI